jgi:hypothetical protein
MLSAVTGTIKKNIQTATMHIFSCVVWVLNVSKYIDIRPNTSIEKVSSLLYSRCVRMLNRIHIYVWVTV